MIYFRHYEVLDNTALCKTYRDQCKNGSHRGAVLAGTCLFTTQIIKKSSQIGVLAYVLYNF